MKLNRISAQDDLTQSVVNRMMATSPVLADAEFYRIKGNAEYLRKAATATGGDFRALNSPPAENKVNPDFVLVPLKIYSGQVEVDKANKRRGDDIDSERARQLFVFGENMAKNFTAEFFKSSVSSSAFDGLAALVPEAQKLTPSENGFEVVAGNDNTAKKSKEKFLEEMRKLRALVGGATAYYMNMYVLNRLTTIAADYIKWEKNEFGVVVPFFDGIPLRDVGNDAEENMVLPNTEVCGSSANTSSVYAVRWGDKKDLTMATSTGVEVADLGLVDPHYKHSVDFDAVPVLQRDKAVAQLKGVIIP